MIKCEFCSILELLSKCKQPEEIKTKYSAALVCEGYRDGRLCSRTTNYGQELNYCPECGRKLMLSAAEEAQE